METNTILVIGIIAGFVCFCMVTLAYMVLMAVNECEDFDDVLIHRQLHNESFDLPKKLHEIEEEHKKITEEIKNHLIV